MTTARVEPALERLLTTEEVADWLQVSVDTVKWWRARKRGPRSIAVGKHRRYRRADVEAWLNAQAAS